MKDYQKQFKSRRSKILRDPFEMPEAPKVVESGMAVHGKKDLENIDIVLKFDQDDIQKYDELNSDAKAEFLNRCQSKEMCQNLLAWLALELRFLHVCEALATYPQKTIQQTDEIVGASALAAGGAGDDDDDDDHANEGGGVEGGAGGDGDGEGEGEGDGGGVPKSVSPSANIHDFLH